MLKIKLSRTGKKNQPRYRVIVAEARSKRDGKFADKIGHYNPQSEPAVFVLDKERYDFWIKQGAQPTETVNSLVNKYTK